IDLYHFQLSGSANYAVRLEAFAGRIGSPLDAAISLFRVNPVDGLLHLVALSDGTGNMTQTFAGTQTPLASDSRLTVALTAGDYYIAVTGLGYAPAALTNPLVPAPYSVFDPTVPTPFGGTTTGDYVLNVSVVADNTPPKVASVSVNSGTPLVDGAILAAPPTGFSIVYSEPVNLEQPAAQAFALNNDPRLNYVYIVGPSGTFYPRFASFTDDGATAQFRMYDPLPSGTYELHLSGPGGLTDFAGNPLVGNTPSGDFVITFTVNAPSRGSSQGPRTWIVHNQQNIGPLFPTELQHVVTLVQPASATLSAPTTDAFQVQLTQNKRYTFSLTSSVLPPGMQFSVTDSSGTPVKGRVARSPGKIVIIALLSPDVYTIHVSGWSAKAGFSVNISIDLAAEAAPPLTIGPGAGVPLRSLAGVAPAPPPAPPTDNGSSPKFPSAGSNGAIIVAVGLTGGATASRPLDPGSVPPEVLAGLGTGQLGSITGTSAGKGPDVYDRLLSGGLDPSFTQLIVQLPILVQVHDSGTGQENAATFAPAALVQEIVRVLSNIDWSAVGEVLQRIENWSMDHLLPVTPPVEDEFLPGIDVPAMPKAPEPALPPRQEDDGATSEASIQALAFTAALAGAGRERERRWRTGASRRKGVVKGS
ncbi:MAG TPA: Ig-like domain-containing protein, partial [Gemmataceae bacterium]|nr:Ig-like domain-containing protein [Gemmataceae bacterium]